MTRGKNLRVGGILFSISLSTLLFSCNKGYTVQSSNYRQYGISNEIEPDSSLIKFYTPFKNKMEGEMNRVIGESTAALEKSSDPENGLSNFFTDATLGAARKLDPKVQFAFPTTKGGIRTSLPKGNITVSNVFELMPFDNELVILKLSGAGVKKVLNFIARSEGQPVSGVRLTIKNKTFQDVTIDGQPFDPNREYIVATSDYLANSTDEQSVMSGALSRTNTGLKLRDVLMNYIEEETKQGRKISPKVDGRIVVQNDK